MIGSEAFLVFPATLAAPFIVIFLLRNGFQPWACAIYYTISFGAEIAFVHLVTRLPTVRIRTIGVAAMLLGTLHFLSLGLLNGHGWPLLIFPPILWSASMVSFWIPFNTLIINATHRENRGFIFGISFLLFPVMNAVAPVMAGTLVTWMGYPALWAACGLILAWDAIWIYFIGGFRDRMMVGSRCSGRKSVLSWSMKLGFMGSGGQEGVWVVAMPLMSFRFTGSEMGLGILISAVAVLGAVAAVLAGRVSDRISNRTWFVRIFAALSIPFIIIAALSPNLWLYAITMGATYALIPVVYIFLFAKMADENEKEPIPAIISREIQLNTGRLLGAIVVLAITYFIGLEVAMLSAAAFIALCILIR